MTPRKKKRASNPWFPLKDSLGSFPTPGKSPPRGFRSDPQRVPAACSRPPARSPSPGAAAAAARRGPATSDNWSHSNLWERPASAERGHRSTNMSICIYIYMIPYSVSITYLTHTYVYIYITYIHIHLYVYIYIYITQVYIYIYIVVICHSIFELSALIQGTWRSHLVAHRDLPLATPSSDLVAPLASEQSAQTTRTSRPPSLGWEIKMFN